MSESLCYRFEKIDLEEFGSIEGITDKGYYDNSFHVSSKIKIDPFEKIRLEAPFHQIASGGHISYLETDSLKKNISALDKIVKYAVSVNLHYFGVNQPVDNCHECGFKGEFLATEKGFECPQCGNHDSKKMNVIRRVNKQAPFHGDMVMQDIKLLGLLKVYLTVFKQLRK